MTRAIEGPAYALAYRDGRGWCQYATTDAVGAERAIVAASERGSRIVAVPLDRFGTRMASEPRDA